MTHSDDPDVIRKETLEALDKALLAEQALARADTGDDVLKLIEEVGDTSYSYLALLTRFRFAIRRTL